MIKVFYFGLLQLSVLFILLVTLGFPVKAETSVDDETPTSSRLIAFIEDLDKKKKATVGQEHQKPKHAVVAQVTRSVSGPRKARKSYETRIKAEVNRWALGLAAGKLVGTPIRLAAELAAVVDDGKDLNVIPMITRGPSANVHALLFMRGVDLAIINADILDYYKKDQRIPNIQDRLNYITQLFHSEFHVLARPEIQSIEDLEGKVVNFNTKGTSASFSGPEILKRMGVRVKEKFISHKVALKKIRQNKDISALVFVTGKSIKALNKIKWPKGFRLLSASYNERLSDYYLPTILTHNDYPQLILKGETIKTVAVPTVLVAYNWKPNTMRYRRVERFVDYMFKRWGKLQEDPFHSKWKNINLAARVKGWKRLPIVQAHINRMDRTRGKKTVTTFEPYRKKSQAKMRADFEKFLGKYARANDVKHFSPEQKERLFKLFYKFSQENGG